MQDLQSTLFRYLLAIASLSTRLLKITYISGGVTYAVNFPFPVGAIISSTQIGLWYVIEEKGLYVYSLMFSMKPSQAINLQYP